MSTAETDSDADSDADRPPRRTRATVSVRSDLALTTGLGGLRRSNTALVARTLLQRGAPARSEIAAATGLSPTSVTKITALMMRARVLTEGATLAGGEAGRPRVPVTLDPTFFRFAGIHIGLRRTTGGLLDLSGNVVTEHAITHRRRSRSAILQEVRELREELERIAGGPIRVLGTGIATGGRVDPSSGVVVDHPLLGWREVQLADEVGATHAPVFIDSSVRSLALAESYLGVARGLPSSAFLFIGNIVGVGLMIDGRLRQGREAAAGTIDHLPIDGARANEACQCGSRSCLASVASDVAVLARARHAGLVGPQASFESLVSRSRSGDKRAVALLRTRAEHAGVAAALLIDLLDPDVVVLGGGLLQTPEHLDALRASAAVRLSRPAAAERIHPTGLGEGSLVRGAASLVMDAFFSDPVSMLPADLVVGS
jgi:predicted NBD/HSP70 family sugar kinase